MPDTGHANLGPPAMDIGLPDHMRAVGDGADTGLPLYQLLDEQEHLPPRHRLRKLTAEKARLESILVSL